MQLKNIKIILQSDRYGASSIRQNRGWGKDSFIDVARKIVVAIKG